MTEQITTADPIRVKEVSRVQAESSKEAVSSKEVLPSQYIVLQGGEWCPATAEEETNGIKGTYKMPEYTPADGKGDNVQEEYVLDAQGKVRRKVWRINHTIGLKLQNSDTDKYLGDLFYKLSSVAMVADVSDGRKALSFRMGAIRE